jgi:glycosyltransferase involved in cell wall biosynthesis
MRAPGRPRISVAVPLFNKAPYITRCLESIRRQTFPDFEVIVVDDGSTDDGGALAGQMEDPRFRVVTQVNRGVGAARNRGILESRGELIAFLDADDEWAPKFLESIINLAREYPEAGILATGYRRSYGLAFDKEITVAAPRQGYTLLIKDYFCHVQLGDFVTSSSVAIPRSVLNEIGTFLEDEPIGEDTDLWARISLRYATAFDVRILATYHCNATERSFERWRSNPPFPPPVRSLRRALAGGHVPAAMVRHVQAYNDWRVMAYAYWLLQLRRDQPLKRLLRTERFVTPRFHLEALLLRMVLPILPMAVVEAVKWKPLRLVNWIRHTGLYHRLARSTSSSPKVVTRLVRAGRGRAGETINPVSKAAPALQGTTYEG